MAVVILDILLFFTLTSLLLLAGWVLLEAYTTPRKKKAPDCVYLNLESDTLFTTPHRFSRKHLRVNPNIKYIGEL
jgi:hypothetical protein